ncbi:MAG: cytidine deaminase [Acidobacteriota bacterium]
MNPAIDWDVLADAAVEARKHAYAPYSGFAVGSAVLTDAGDIVSGANVENSVYGLGICAERVAISAAVAQGARRIVAIAVCADIEPPARPCGPCLQVMAEFSDDIPILLCSTQSLRHLSSLRELLPQPFSLPRPS